MHEISLIREALEVQSSIGGSHDGATKNFVLTAVKNVRETSVHTVVAALHRPCDYRLIVGFARGTSALFAIVQY